MMIAFFRFYVFLVLCFFLVLSSPARANFMVYPMSALLPSGESTVLRIYSKKNDIQYIRLSVKKVMNPATRLEHEVPVKSWEADSLIASPQKIILPAGSSKAVRLNLISSPAAETLYRVYFESVNADGSLAAGKKIQGAPEMKVSLNIAYAALIRVLPETVINSLQVVKSGDRSIKIKNAGNVRAAVTGLAFCKKNEMSNDCQKINYRRYIYPQQESESSFSYQDGYHWALINILGENDKEERIALPIE
ncbi:fimbrial protein [Salmonella enterica]|uniref:fimbrial protein n=1 Tax=Salmonella enterica TaxID=28901 RepID=UPI001118AC07|nr:fimbrial protein [Salmonella enterica]EBD0851661.1 fimbrial protein [Salmonella enterica]EBF2435114.1 fimbrial protein [Salmonella enterica]ECE2168177.1 fimbrial protein [Salmonella enterica]ECV6476210.1 fimbrial protein [Salmonella enterica]EDR5750692.1 fimbrial protein [Salmonella enterica subsp. enterica serovar Cubana]